MVIAAVRKQQGDVNQERQPGGGCQQLVIPLSPRDRSHDDRKAEECMKPRGLANPRGVISLSRAVREEPDTKACKFVVE
jgi:hypothetical protein